MRLILSFLFHFVTEQLTESPSANQSIVILRYFLLWCCLCEKTIKSNSVKVQKSDFLSDCFMSK